MQIAGARGVMAPGNHPSTLNSSTRPFTLDVNIEYKFVHKNCIIGMFCHIFSLYWKREITKFISMTFNDVIEITSVDLCDIKTRDRIESMKKREITLNSTSRQAGNQKKGNLYQGKFSTECHKSWERNMWKLFASTPETIGFKEFSVFLSNRKVAEKFFL